MLKRETFVDAISKIKKHEELMERSSIYQEVYYSQQKGGKQ